MVRSLPEETSLAFESIGGFAEELKKNPFHCCQDVGHVLLFSASLLTGLTARAAKRVFLRSLQEKFLARGKESFSKEG